MGSNIRLPALPSRLCRNHCSNTRTTVRKESSQRANISFETFMAKPLEVTRFTSENIIQCPKMLATTILWLEVTMTCQTRAPQIKVTNCEIAAPYTLEFASKVVSLGMTTSSVLCNRARFCCSIRLVKIYGPSTLFSRNDVHHRILGNDSKQIDYFYLSGSNQS